MLYKNMIKTQKEGLYDITKEVMQAVQNNNLQNGLCIIYCPHTTAAITINENADPDVKHDLLIGLEKAFPDRNEFKHMEGNSSAHLKVSCLGASETVIVENGRLVLGTWQGIYFCEFDGPRTRTFWIKLIK